MNTVTVAVGAQYEIEAQRLLSEYPQTILITEKTKGIERDFDSPIINGLATKCKFGLLLPDDLKGPIFLCDADLYPNKKHPLKEFSVKAETEIAYVLYPGVWYFPPKLEVYQRAIRKVGKANSGFIYFKNLEICREICSQWHSEYVSRMKRFLEKTEEDFTITGEYDEPSLISVLAKNDYKIEFLDPRWNVWKTSEVHREEAFFIQDHIGDYNMYDLTPGFRNEA